MIATDSIGSEITGREPIPDSNHRTRLSALHGAAVDVSPDSDSNGSEITSSSNQTTGRLL